MSKKSDIKSKAFSAIIWKLLERMSAQLVSMIVSIILARMLTPDDYSAVSVVAIFFIFCNVFISGGFNTALIQKKDSDIIDYSSVLFVSLGISVILYAVMFFAAPTIAYLFEKPILVPVIRVMSLMLIVTAYKGVVCAKVSSSLKFRNFFISTIIGTIISAVVGITMASYGFGVWALVAQQMSNAIIDSLILTVTTKIKFKFVISIERLKGLFSYGWKMLVTSFISVLYDETKPLIVGLKFSTVDLAFYNKGKSFPQLLNSTICDSISAVLFPVIAKLQDDKEAVLSATRRFMSISSYIIFPLLIGFFVVSDAFIEVLLTAKWLPASPYVKIFCISFVFNIIQKGNLQAIRAIGRSDIILKLEIIKKTIYFIIIALFVWISESPQMIAVSGIICTFIATVINTYPNRKLIGYRYSMQIMDLLPNFLLSILMGVVVYFVGIIKFSASLLLLIQVIVGMVTYVTLSLITKNSNLKYLLDFIKEKRGK